MMYSLKILRLFSEVLKLNLWPLYWSSLLVILRQAFRKFLISSFWVWACNGLVSPHRILRFPHVPWSMMDFVDGLFGERNNKFIPINYLKTWFSSSCMPLYLIIFDWGLVGNITNPFCIVHQPPSIENLNE